MGHSYRSTQLPNYNQRHDNFTCHGDIVHKANGSSLLFSMSPYTQFWFQFVLDSVLTDQPKMYICHIHSEELQASFCVFNVSNDCIDALCIVCKNKIIMLKKLLLFDTDK